MTTFKRPMINALDEALAQQSATTREDASRKAAAAAADREADPVKTRAAQLLGCPVREIRSVRRSRLRRVLVITTTAGTEYAWAPPDQPDADGRTGLLMWSSTRYRTALPTYARTPTRPPAEAPEAPEPSPDDEPTVPPWSDGTQEALAALRAELVDLLDPSTGDDLGQGIAAQIGAVDQLLAGRSARLADAHERAHPEPPSDEELDYARQAVEISDRIAGTPNPAEQQAIFEAFAPRWRPTGRLYFTGSANEMLQERARGAYRARLAGLEAQAAAAGSTS